MTWEISLVERLQPSWGLPSTFKNSSLLCFEKVTQIGEKIILTQCFFYRICTLIIAGYYTANMEDLKDNGGHEMGFAIIAALLIKSFAILGYVISRLNYLKKNSHSLLTMIFILNETEHSFTHLLHYLKNLLSTRWRHLFILVRNLFRGRWHNTLSSFASKN